MQTAILVLGLAVALLSVLGALQAKSLLNDFRSLQSDIERLRTEVAQIVNQIAISEHLRMVEEGTRVSEEVLAEGWDNPLDAKYDDHEPDDKS